MFDLRYHLASLAAVFIALAVGILLGVAISGKLSAADNRFAHDRIDQLSEQLQQANATGGHHREAKQGGRAAARDQLPGADGGTTRRQEHRRALRSGPWTGPSARAIERTLSDAGAGSPVRLIAVDTPVDAGELDSALNGDQTLAAVRRERRRLRGISATHSGRSSSTAKGTPTWSSLSSKLVEERSGATHASARRRRRRPLLGARRGCDLRAGGAGAGRRRPSSTASSAG